MNLKTGVLLGIVVGILVVFSTYSGWTIGYRTAYDRQQTRIDACGEGWYETLELVSYLMAERER